MSLGSHGEYAQEQLTIYASGAPTFSESERERGGGGMEKERGGKRRGDGEGGKGKQRGWVGAEQTWVEGVREREGEKKWGER